MARRGIFVVIEIVVPKQFLPRGNVAQGENPYPVFDLIDLAVRIAGVIKISGDALAVDDDLAVP
jgi:hypothetical protein